MKKSNPQAEIYERMIRNVLLKEAILTVGAGENEKNYYMPDDIANNTVFHEENGQVKLKNGVIDLKAAKAASPFKANEDSNKADESVIDPTQDPMQHVMQIIDSFTNSTVQKIAKSIYFKHSEAINRHVSTRGQKMGTPIAFDKKEPWMTEMYFAADNDRGGAVGKGEVLAAIYWGGFSSDQHEGAVDLRFGANKLYSVKSDRVSDGIYGLNGAVDDVKKNLKSYAEFLSQGYPEIQALLNSTDVTHDKIVRAVSKDVATLITDDPSAYSTKCVAILGKLLKALDASVQQLSSGKYEYMLFSDNLDMQIISPVVSIDDSSDTTNIVFDSISQGKVRIRKSPGSYSRSQIRLMSKKGGERYWVQNIGDAESSITVGKIKAVREDAANELIRLFNDAPTVQSILNILDAPPTRTKAKNPVDSKTPSVNPAELRIQLSKLFTGTKGWSKGPEFLKKTKDAIREIGSETDTVESFTEKVLASPTKTVNENFQLLYDLIKEVLKSR